MDKIDLKRSKERLCTSSQRFWEDTMKLINTVAIELNMTKVEKDAFVQRAAAQIIYKDLEATNEYLRKTGGSYADKKIRENTLEMQRVSHIYSDNAKYVQRIQAEANSRLTSMMQSTATKQTPLSRKGGNK